MPEQYSILGSVTGSDGAELTGVTVRAFHRDLPSVERRTNSKLRSLGATMTDAHGKFRLAYSLEAFQSGEGLGQSRPSNLARVDVSFELHDEFGKVLPIRALLALNRDHGADGMIFNAPQSLEVSIQLLANSEVRGSEFELLSEMLAPVIEDVPLSHLSDDDIDFLNNELGLDQQRDVQQRIQWLRRSALLAGDTRLPIEAFYGWARKDVPATLAELAGVPLKDLAAVLEKLASLRVEKLRAALAGAIDDNIIPATLRERIESIVRTLATRSLELRHVEAKLVDADSSAALTEFTVDTIDMNPEGGNLGRDITDRNGGFAFDVYVPRTGASGTASRQFTFKLTTPAGESLAITPTLTVDDAKLGTESVAIKVSLPKSAVPTVDDHLKTLNLRPPPAVSKWLADKGIASLADIRKKGGLRRLADQPPDDPALVRKLDALADLDRVSTSIMLSHDLLAKGFDSVLAIADSPLSEFSASVTNASTELSGSQVARLHLMATVQTKLLNNMLMAQAVTAANGFVLPSSDAATTP